MNNRLRHRSGHFDRATVFAALLTDAVTTPQPSVCARTYSQTGVQSTACEGKEAAFHVPSKGRRRIS